MSKTEMAKRGVVKNGRVYHLNRIRVDCELTGFPIHNLAARDGKQTSINIRGVDKTGRSIHWEVSPNAKYGHPGELAYKLDTLIINKRIDECRNKGTIPKLIKLGSLRNIADSLNIDVGGRTNKQIERSFLQNASAFITAKFTYITNEGEERTFTAAFTRYDIVLTGSKLPNGRKADQVYVVPHDLFLELLNSSRTRPLDYDYLRELSPSAQRFYELIAPVIFACIKHNNEHATYLYSSFCTSSALTRYDSWDKVKRQMYKVLKPHRDSGYINSVSYHEIVDSLNRPDWEIYLVPGERARKEFAEFTGAEYTSPVLEPKQGLLPFPELTKKPTEAERVADELKKLGVTGKVAEGLANEFSDRAKQWIAVAKKGFLGKVKEPGAYLAMAIANDYALPKAFLDVVKREKLARIPKPEDVDTNSPEYLAMCQKFGVSPDKK